ncbi:peroxiredoxin [Halosimplex marinum]|uniref:peroxiredoxin n=1 Tax=Halosimplex marinum TaxID=3396620 RepID=UPI003F565AFA
MLSEGAEAPAVDLPAYVDGERRRVDLDDYLGEGIVVLAFYPADFNPACTMGESDLDDLDLFTMQKDVSVFGVSPDSTYSHEAFAERYGLHVPLLSDREGEAAEAYGVATENEVGEPLVRRSVFVVDHRGTVQYAGAADGLEASLDVAPVKAAVGDIGGDDTALERYRVGHDHYAEGREAFRAAMDDYEDREWMDARSGFEDAEPAFTAAADHFDTAVRFAETADFETVVDRTEEKADTLAHAARWLADSADALASGRGEQGAQYREDAQRLLDAATDLPEPPESDAFRLTADGVELGESVVVDRDAVEDEGYDWRADDAGGADTGLGVDDADLDAAVAGEGDDYERSDEPDTVEGDLEMDLEAVEAAADEDDEAEESNVEGDTVEGDTVEGDLEMDLDAVAAAEQADDAAGGQSDGADDEPDGASGGPAGEADAGAGRATEPDGASGLRDGEHAGSGVAPATTEADGEETDGDGTDGEASVAELDLADPTEGDDGDEEDERADWDIPGR